MNDLDINYKAHWEIARSQLQTQFNEAERLRKIIEWWLNERMIGYTDNQYGIREMKQSLEKQ